MCGESCPELHVPVTAPERESNMPIAHPHSLRFPTGAKPARWGLLGILLLAIGWTLGCGQGETSAAPHPPYPGKNLVLLTIDTLRADHLPAYGYPRPTSPNIDRLARDGTTFENAFAARGHTWPSLTTLLTARYPRSTNVRGPKELLREGFPTTVELLESAGYQTRAFLTNFCEIGCGIFENCQCAGDEKTIADAIRWLQQREGEQPFFLWVHLLRPHLPYKPVARYDRFTNKNHAAKHGKVDGSRPAINAIYQRQHELSSEDLAYLNGLYDGEILWADALLGRLLDALERRRLLDESLVVFSSDHGEDLYQHNKFFEHGCSIYDSSLQVPLIVRLPDGRRADTRTSDVVGLIDLMPTLLDLLGVPKLSSFEGESFAPLLLDGTAKSFQGVISEHYREQQGAELLSIRTQRWRYIYNPANAIPHCTPATNHYRIAEEELYDHENDRLETTNVVQSHRGVADQLKRELLERYPIQQQRSPALETDDPETLERLKALGYIAE